MIAGVLTGLFIVLEFGFLARSLLRPHRDPASRLAWVVVLLALPLLGMIGQPLKNRAAYAFTFG